MLPPGGWKLWGMQARLNLCLSLPSLMSRPACNVLRAAINATAGPSRVPATSSFQTWRSPACRNRETRTCQHRQLRWNTSTATPKTPTSPVNPLQLPAFEGLVTSLSSSQPCFGARGDEIALLTSPVQFKAALLEMIKRAKRRIIISSLYIGAEEEELVRPLTL